MATMVGKKKKDIVFDDIIVWSCIFCFITSRFAIKSNLNVWVIAIRKDYYVKLFTNEGSWRTKNELTINSHNEITRICFDTITTTFVTMLVCLKKKKKRKRKVCVLIKWKALSRLWVVPFLE